jgi:glycosyltransferase involved in cell wall biosynthesis
MTRTLDFQKWAVVAFKDDTGLGRQARDLRNVLPLGRQIVIPSERLAGHPLSPDDEVLLAPDAPEENVREALHGLQGIFFFERASWHPALLRCARELGVKTVGVPNWEWFRSDDTNWNYCDLFACVNEMGLRTVRSFGRSNSICLPWCLDLGSLPVRKVSGPARVFIHNGGIVDADDRKGTRETIEAFGRVKRDDIRLVVRLQKEVPLPKLDSRMDVQFGNIASHADLYRTGDVAIQPSKMEGIGFSVLEAIGAGFPVITTDYPPMNEYVQQPELRVETHWFNRKAFPTPWVKQAHLRLPTKRDLSRKIAWCAETDMGPYSNQNRAWAEATFSPDHLRSVWAEALDAKLFSTNAKS